MSNIVGIVDYGNAGNIYNVQKALTLLGAETKVIKSNRDFDKVDRIILPGVGGFSDAMKSISAIRERLLEEALVKPVLGICLGMQLLSTVGFEYGETEGLDLISAEVKLMEVKAKVPHIGWAKLDIISECPLLKGISEDDNFYFMHSYEVINYTDLYALTSYNKHKYVSVVGTGNIYGVQFHPEKSREQGLKILDNFLKL